MPPNMNPVGEPCLPAGFTCVRDVLDGKLHEKARVNIAGIVIDFRTPVATRGKDWKCQVRFFDVSVQDDYEASLSVNIFRPENEMPNVECGDAILLQGVKIQRYQGEAWSLLTSWDTKIHVYKASSIPKPPGNASNAMRTLPRPKDGDPSRRTHTFISQMFHAVEKDRIPQQSEFEVMKIQSANVKDKFSLLKDVVDGRFCDIVAMVVKEPYDMGDKMTLWVSDFTENSAFFHYTFGGATLGDERDGDPFNYTSKSSTVTSNADWKGPFGKRSIQITCFEPHATAVREVRITIGSWVSIRNLQIKFGRNTSNLEGYLREDQGAHGIKIGIRSLDPAENPETIDPQFKEAIRRRRDYERAKKEQLKDIAGAAKAGQKRKAETISEQEPKKKKSRNQKKRQSSAIQKDEPKQKELIPIADLSTQVKCENQNKAASLVAEMLEPAFYTATVNGKPVQLQLPFVNLNYRGNVRVVNYLPSKLEDFSFPKQPSEYDVLSDNDDSDSGSDSEHDMMTDFTAVRNWEWRFLLELEDAAVPQNQEKKRVWVVVDNQAAQCLLNLDASNLRHSKKNLEQLRRTLFSLWGDLEKHKCSEQTKRVEAAREGKPPLDSDDEDRSASKLVSKDQFTNQPFPCCIRQYGVKIREPDATKANAGGGRRWQRIFGLFGTRISAS